MCDSISAWPACPDCGLRRMTRCPACRVADDRFALGDANGSDPDPAAEWLICSSCDEPFQPEYYRLCQNCGHDFGAGIAIVRSLPETDLNDRAVWLAAALALLCFVLAAYFAWLLR